MYTLFPSLEFFSHRVFPSKGFNEAHYLWTSKGECYKSIELCGLSFRYTQDLIVFMYTCFQGDKNHLDNYVPTNWAFIMEALEMISQLYK